MVGEPERYIIDSDASHFVGRVYDLSIVALHFESYEDLASFPDAKYAFDVNERTSLLTRRVESLNHVGELLWPKKPTEVGSLSVSAYEYCNLIHDSFLMRMISVLDCCCLLLAEVIELKMSPRQVNLGSLRKLVPANLCLVRLERLSDLQMSLRSERNIRFHRGEEQWLTDDDETFKIAALWAHRGQPMTGEDRHGRSLDLNRFYRLAIDHLRSKFKSNSKVLTKALDEFYEGLNLDFEERFRAKCGDAGSFMRKSRKALR